MYKRKGNFQSGGFSKHPHVEYGEADSTTSSSTPAMAASGGTGALGVGDDGEKTKQPIYDSLRDNQLCFNFTERTWEEISTKPSMTGFQFTYNRFFTDDVCRVLNHYFHCTKAYKSTNIDSYAMPFRGFKIIPGKITLSNFIVLSDNIQVGAGGVNEVSSFVQKSKICVFHKKRSELPYSYFTENAEGDITNFMTFDRSNLFVKKQKTTVNNLSEVTIDNYESIESLRYLPHGHRPRKNLFNSSRTNNVSSIEKQMFPNYVGCSIYEDMYDTDKAGVVQAEYVVSRKAGLFGKYSKTNSNIEQYSAIGITNRKNYIRENMNFDIIDGGEVINFQTLPPSDMINLTPSRNGVYYNETPFKASKAAYQDGVVSNIYYTGKHMGVDQAYLNECVTTNIVDRIMSIKNKGLGHEFICMIPIRKSDNTIMKLRASCMFETSFKIILYGRRDKEWLDQEAYDPGTPADAEDGPSFDSAELNSQVENTKKLRQKVSLPYFVLNEQEDMCVFP